MKVWKSSFNISFMMIGFFIFMLFGPQNICYADACPTCQGSGKCQACGGAGYLSAGTCHGQPAVFGCTECGGVRGDPCNSGGGSAGSGLCPTCGGSGQVPGANPAGSDPSQSANEAAERQRALEAQRLEAEALKKKNQERFQRDKEEALRQIKGIAENEFELKGIGGDLELKGIGETQTNDYGLKPLFEKGSPGSAPVDSRVKGPSKLDIGVIRVQAGVANPAQLKKDLLTNFSGAILKRTEQANAQAQQILRSFKTGEPPNPIKNLTNLAPGDVILVAPVRVKERLKDESIQHAKDVLISNGINFLDRWGSDNWSSPASHAAIFLGVRNGERWYLDNTSAHGPVILAEKDFLKEYGQRGMDVATLVGQPLSQHEGQELWKGAHELRKTTRYGIWANDKMVCSETSRWLLVRAGRWVPETQSPDAKIRGVDTGLNKKKFVNFSPSDFFESQQYFVVHKLGMQSKGE
jgi:hypothetical protein